MSEVARASEIHRGGEQRGTRAPREQGWTGRQRCALAEELDLDSVTGDVAVAEEGRCDAP